MKPHEKNHHKGCKEEESLPAYLNLTLFNINTSLINNNHVLFNHLLTVHLQLLNVLHTTISSSNLYYSLLKPKIFTIELASSLIEFLRVASKFGTGRQEEHIYIRPPSPLKF